MANIGFSFGEPNTSLWQATVDRVEDAGTPLPPNSDVVIVGAGFTGLWTAYYLKRISPELSVTIVEANHVGFGASGRCGGWAIGSLDGQHLYMRGLEQAAARKAVACITGAVDEVGAVIAREGITCGFHKGGLSRIAARNTEQRRVLSEYEALICAENGSAFAIDVLDADGTAALAGVREPMGAVFFPHCAVLNPARLAHGLAGVLRAAGVAIVERCRAIAVKDRVIETDRGPIGAGAIVLGTEAYAASLARTKDRVLPVYSHIVATAPLPGNVRRSLGLERRQAFSDCSEIHSYGQITEDDRVVFGALVSYPFGARLGSMPHRHFADCYALIHRVLVDLFPQLEDAPIAHRWSGALGVPRGFKPAIAADTAKRLYVAGGYLGRGVAAANLFGQTVAELIVAANSERTACPWVFKDAPLREAFPAWEPEPLRWLGATSRVWPGTTAERALLEKRPLSPVERGLAHAARWLTESVG